MLSVLIHESNQLPLKYTATNLLFNDSSVIISSSLSWFICLSTFFCRHCRPSLSLSESWRINCDHSSSFCDFLSPRDPQLADFYWPVRLKFSRLGSFWTHPWIILCQHHDAKNVNLFGLFFFGLKTAGIGSSRLWTIDLVFPKYDEKTRMGCNSTTSAIPCPRIISLKKQSCKEETSASHNTIKIIRESGKISVCKGKCQKTLVIAHDLWALR